MITKQQIDAYLEKHPKAKRLGRSTLRKLLQKLAVEPNANVDCLLYEIQQEAKKPN